MIEKCTCDELKCRSSCSSYEHRVSCPAFFISKEKLPPKKIFKKKYIKERKKREI
jgi:predicted metal-binding protein